MKVFVVFGQTGEYSDHDSWPVRGFVSRERAEAFEMACTKAAMAFNDSARRYRETYAMPTSEELRSAVPGDPSFRWDYTGTDYYTIEVDVESEP